MKHSSSTARRALSLALGTALVSLAACGGFTAVDVGGTITNLIGNGLVIANGSSTVSPAAGATTFTFPQQVEIRSPYNVAITQQPTRQTCQVINGAGIAGAAPVTIVNISCATNAYALSGTVTGLAAGNSVVLANGGDQVTATAGAPSFTFPTAVADGTAYGVAVLSQPTNQTCAVANGTAFMGGAPVTNVTVTCR